MEWDSLSQREIDTFEHLIDGLMEKQYGHCETFLEPAILEGLRTNLLRYKENGQMQPAGIGKKTDYQKNREVRGDVIRWIESETQDPFEAAFIQLIEKFVLYLNRTCYTALNAYEFHYASYGPDKFYKRHLDQFRADKGRRYSFILYLNNDWKEENGGKLTLFVKDRPEEYVYPHAGTLVFFKSDELEHEVLPAIGRDRMSIAGWLKSV